VYCFDPREYALDQQRSSSGGGGGESGESGGGNGGLDRTGPFRAAFVVAALRDLRAALRQRGSDLAVRIGRPEEVLPQVGGGSCFAGGGWLH